MTHDFDFVMTLDLHLSVPTSRYSHIYIELIFVILAARRASMSPARRPRVARASPARRPRVARVSPACRPRVARVSPYLSAIHLLILQEFTELKVIKIIIIHEVFY